MPRPLLRATEELEQTKRLSVSTGAKTSKKKEQSIQEKMKLDRLLRRPRSKKYLEAMKALDAGGHVHNQEQVKQIIDAICQEFPEVEITGVLLGCVSVCYLGDPYEVHSIDLGGQILTHYKRGQAMPGQLEKVRGLAMRGGYEFIEVYVDCCRAISSTGAVSVIPY